MLRAVCGYTDNPDAWFPDDDTPNDDVAAAVAVCRFRCPVWQECAAYAVLTEQTHGIHAGIRLDDRRSQVRTDLLRRELETADLSQDLASAIAETAQAQRRRSRAAMQRNGSTSQPRPLAQLLTECAPKQPTVISAYDLDGRECA
jgi:hypothetical protein